MEGSRAVLLFLCVSLLSSAATHKLQCLYTSITPRTNCPECAAVGLLDGEQFEYYDDNMKKMFPRTEWIKNISADDPRYWDRETEMQENDQDRLKFSLNEIMQSFRQTEGLHTLQRVYSCDDSTTRGYDQYGYDGEDFISLDLNTGTWTAAKPQAEIFKQMWDPTGAKAKHQKSYLENECIDRLKKFLSYGRETLERKVRPEVSVFQKHSSSPEVVCHATGFFPKAVNITWQKDGEDVHEEDVELRETLPNRDGSFQKRSILKVPAEELQKHTYTCVIQHSSLEKELVLSVSERRILRGGGSGGGSGVALIFAVILVLVIIFAGIVFWKKSRERRKKTDVMLSEDRLTGSKADSQIYTLCKTEEEK